MDNMVEWICTLELILEKEEKTMDSSHNAPTKCFTKDNHQQWHRLLFYQYSCNALTEGSFIFDKILSFFLSEASRDLPEI